MANEGISEGYVDFGGVIPPREQAVPIPTQASIPRASKGTTAPRCQGDVKLFLNYKEIYAKRGLNQPNPGGERIPFRLFEGWNHLVIKVTKGSGPWGFYMELTDVAGPAAARSAIRAGPGGVRLRIHSRFSSNSGSLVMMPSTPAAAQVFIASGSSTVQTQT